MELTKLELRMLSYLSEDHPTYSKSKTLLKLVDRGYVTRDVFTHAGGYWFKLTPVGKLALEKHNPECDSEEHISQWSDMIIVPPDSDFVLSDAINQAIMRRNRS